MQFSKNGAHRLFSASLDRQFKVYDIAAKICIRTIQSQGGILRVVIDHSESNLFLGCDNNNIYHFSLEV